MLLSLRGSTRATATACADGPADSVPGGSVNFTVPDGATTVAATAALGTAHAGFDNTFDGMLVSLAPSIPGTPPSVGAAIMCVQLSSGTTVVLGTVLPAPVVLSRDTHGTMAPPSTAIFGPAARSAAAASLGTAPRSTIDGIFPRTALAMCATLPALMSALGREWGPFDETFDEMLSTRPPSAVAAVIVGGEAWLHSLHPYLTRR